MTDRVKKAVVGGASRGSDPYSESSQEDLDAMKKLSPSLKQQFLRAPKGSLKSILAGYRVLLSAGKTRSVSDKEALTRIEQLQAKRSARNRPSSVR